MGDELTQAAKDAIADAVRIVKEDKWDAYLKERVAKHSGAPTPNPPTPNPPTPNPPTPNPPTPNPPTPNPPTPNPDDGKRKSAYWGEIFD